MNRIVFILILFVIPTVFSNKKINDKNSKWLKYLKVKVSVDETHEGTSPFSQNESGIEKITSTEGNDRNDDERYLQIELIEPTSNVDKGFIKDSIENEIGNSENQRNEKEQTAFNGKIDANSISSPTDTVTTMEEQVVEEDPKELSSSSDSSITYIVLDEKGRVGPDFEVMEMTVEQLDLSKDNTLVAHKNIALLEKEVMVVDISKYDEKELRERLTNISNLEESKGERHRDLGSSFILPILAACEYDNNSAPLIFSDVPVNVVVQLNILYLANFDSALMEYTTDMEMQLTWYDLRLANNYTHPIRIREKEIMDKIWRPDPYFVNSKFSYFHQVSFPNFRMRVMPDGLVTYTMRVSSVCNCFMTFCLYPHDRQVCDLIISSIAYPSSFVQFHWHSEPVHFQSRIALPELHLERLYTERCHVEGKLLPSSSLRLIFVLERDGGRAVVEKYIPSTLAMMFAWVAPYVPYNYEEVRIVTPITVLLTLVQMEKGDQKIRTSYLTSIDVWFAAMKMFTVFSLIESLTVLALIKQSRAMEKNATRASNEFERIQCKTEAYRLTKLYHRLDSISRFVSPLVFVLFFLYYVLFIAQGDESGCLRKQQISNPFFV